MNKAAIYHRPESEYAYLYKTNDMHVRIRVARNDMKSVLLVVGDPYAKDEKGAWIYKKIDMNKTLSTEEHDFYEIAVDVSHKRMDYMFILVGNDEEKIVLTDNGQLPYKESLLIQKFNAFRMPYFHEIDRFKAPEWVKSTVWYQIFTERFANGDQSNDPGDVKRWNPSETPKRQDFYGGDLQGVLDHLDHLTALGVNGIYFTPIFKAYSNHKYDTENYKEIDPSFGTKELFHQLVRECHARGIRIMLDAVFNHIGDTSPQWQDVLKNQEKSKYADWFHVNEWPARYTVTEDFEHTNDATYDTFAFTPHMPKLNTANPQVQNYLLDIAEYWIREFDIDAWRLDVADEIDHTFWKKFRTTCDVAKKDFYILGEVWHSAQPWLNGDEFSAVMNYAYTGAITDYFLKRKITLSQMISQVNMQIMFYRRQTSEVMFNVLDSHDTPRVLTVAGNDKDLMKQVEAFTYLQPGEPCIWQGDEYAMSGAGDPDCRRCMPWREDDQDLDMFHFFKQLVAFRKNYSKELSESSIVWSRIDEKLGLLEIQRGKIWGLFNVGEKTIPADLKGKELLSKLVVNGKILPHGFVISIE